MPISYEVDASLGVTRVTWTGTATAEDLARHLQKMVQDPAVVRVRRNLADVRGAEVKFKGEDISRLLRSTLAPVLAGPRWRFAVLVREQVQYGVGRQWQAFASDLCDVAIFHDENAALAFLLK